MKQEILKQALVKILKEISPSDFDCIAQNIKIYQYTREPEKDLAPRSAPLLSIYNNPDTFFTAFESGDPACLVAAIDIAKVFNPESIESEVIAALNLGPWRTLQDSLLKLLGNCESEASFMALVKANPFGSHQLRQHRYSGGNHYIQQFLGSDPLVQSYKPWEQLTLPVWNAMTVEMRSVWKEEAKRQESIYNYDDLNLRQNFLYYLGERNCSVDFGWMHTLWTTHPSHKIRLGAGYALLRLSSTNEQALMANHIFSVEKDTRSAALVALIQQDPQTASSRFYKAINNENFSWAAPEKSPFVVDLLNTLNGHPRDSKENPWLLQDKGWIDFFLELKSINPSSASEFLAKYPKEWVKLHLSKRESSTPAKKNVNKKLPGGEKLIEQFRGGESITVWKQLYALGNHIRAPQILPYAEQIASETMKQIRISLEKIVTRLTNMGYVFLQSPLEKLDPEAVRQKVGQLEKHCGSLPLSLKAFYLYVGGCDFRGYHPDWPISSTEQPGFDPRKNNIAWYTDPLVITNVHEALDIAQDSEANDIEIPISGDPLTKAGISGGQYAIMLPCEEADAVLEGEPKNRKLLEYLRHSIEHGGFAGFTKNAKQKSLMEQLTNGITRF